jgi:hypothetical protein
MPRSASVVGLAKRGVIPRKQFYMKLFFFNTVILVAEAAIVSVAGAAAGLLMAHWCIQLMLKLEPRTYSGRS